MVIMYVVMRLNAPMLLCDSPDVTASSSLLPPGTSNTASDAQSLGGQPIASFDETGISNSDNTPVDRPKLNAVDLEAYKQNLDHLRTTSENSQHQYKRGLHV